VSDAVTFFRKRFTAEGNAESAKWQRAYMKSALRFHGVSNAQLRKAAADYAKLHEIDHDDLKSVVEALYATDWFDLWHAGIALLARKHKLIERRDDAWLISLVRRSACWAHVDWLAVKIVPLTLEAKPARQLKAWAKDDDFWVRRTALLAQLDALRDGGGDFALFAQLAVPMLGEKEFFIRKAIGWVLREVSKKRPALVSEFVAEHGEQMAGLTRREATKYLLSADR
jgi:3-methyladenine DNA glycosylase AlkD